MVDKETTEPSIMTYSFSPKAYLIKDPYFHTYREVIDEVGAHGHIILDLPVLELYFRI